MLVSNLGHSFFSPPEGRRGDKDVNNAPLSPQTQHLFVRVPDVHANTHVCLSVCVCVCVCVCVSPYACHAFVLVVSHTQSISPLQRREAAVCWDVCPVTAHGCDPEGQICRLVAQFTLFIRNRKEDSDPIMGSSL